MRDIVDELLHVRFPGDWELDYQGSRFDNFHDYFRGLAEKAYAQFKIDHLLLKEMRANRPDKLAALYADDLANPRGIRKRLLDLFEASRPFNQPGAMADFAYWVKFDRWTLDQSITLLMGRSPNIVKSSRVLGFADVSPFAGDYARWLLLAKQSEAMNYGEGPCEPVKVLAWAREVDIPVPPGLLEAFDEWAAKKLPPSPLPPFAPAATDVADASEPKGLSATDRGRRVTRAALIADNARRWPTIEQDLKDGSTNGLSKAARDTTRGFWYEGSALAWARDRGKLQEPSGGLVHLMKG